MKKEKDVFESLPGVGARIAQDLRDLGYTAIEDLKGQDPQVMYDRFCQLKGHTVDRCLLYVFRCIIYAVSEQKTEKHLLQWWNWSDANMKKYGNIR
ncbi:MAG: Pathogenicity locus [Microgenomates bacterium OLB22]|nr:MAG: Pathogenicity locus [Microgenomates bacterium OLB22]